MSEIQKTAVKEKREVVTLPLQFSKHFMAQWIEDEDGGYVWAIFRLIDFCNPALADGPQAVFFLPDANDTAKLMGELDVQQEIALELQRIAGK